MVQVHFVVQATLRTSLLWYRRPAWPWNVTLLCQTGIKLSGFELLLQIQTNFIIVVDNILEIDDKAIEATPAKRQGITL